MIVNNLRKSIGSKEIFSDVVFTLSNNDKVGLVGPNGAGKSTLLKIISGAIKSDFGSVKFEDETVGCLEQEILYDDCKLSVIDYIKKETKISELEKKLHELENNLNENNMDEYGEVLNIFLSMDGYSFEDKLKMILSGLNLKSDINTTIKNLSGGEKMKVLLATLLLKNPDVLLLDEPTNNLDIKAIEWLENYLKSSNKKMIIVSHDEEFLNSIVNKIYELKDGKIKEYNLSYDEKVKKAQDYNMWVRCAEYGKLYCLQEPLFISRIHEDQIGERCPNEQCEGANITKRMCLSRLLPDYTEREATLYEHMRLVSMEGNGRENLKLIRKLIEANDKKRVYDTHIYKQELIFWWFRKCFYKENRHKTQDIWKTSYFIGQLICSN